MGRKPGESIILTGVNGSVEVQMKTKKSRGQTGDDPTLDAKIETM